MATSTRLAPYWERITPIVYHYPSEIDGRSNELRVYDDQLASGRVIAQFCQAVTRKDSSPGWKVATFSFPDVEGVRVMEANLGDLALRLPS